MSDDDIVIRVDNVSKRFRLYHELNRSLKATVFRQGRAKYEEFWALQNVSFEVPRGTTYGLIGQNGSGKSTLLKCIAKILRPDGGTITVDGKISALLELGAGFHPELSGRDNVFLNAAILGLSEKDVKKSFDNIVEFAGLEQFIDTPVKNYSSGMYVRLGFSVAINVDPDILLVDEVLAVGDETFQRKCSEKFAQFRAEGKTVVLVSHGMGSMRMLCTEVALLEHGRMLTKGEPDDVIQEYLGDVVEERDPDGEFGQRWGSGEATIESVEFFANGKPVGSHANCGDRLVARLHLRANERLNHPVVGVVVTTMEGVHVNGTNTRLGSVDLGIVEPGQFTIDWEVPRLDILRGVYLLSVAVTDETTLGHYDYRQRSFPFTVEIGDALFEEGVMTLRSSWSVIDV